MRARGLFISLFLFAGGLAVLIGTQYSQSEDAPASELEASSPDAVEQKGGLNTQVESDQSSASPVLAATAERTQAKPATGHSTGSPTAPPEDFDIRDLPDKDILARLADYDPENLQYAIEALDRDARCRRYTKHPKARERRLRDVESDPQTVEMLISLWERRDKECPGLDPNLRRKALDWLVIAADAGNIKAQEAYYQRGRESLSTWLREPEWSENYVARVRRYVEPLVDNPQPDTLDFLFSVFRDGLVYPRDYPTSAVYRFASYYNQGLSPAAIDQRRLAWGRNLTDAEIDQAEQAGYALYLECCAP